LDRIQTLNTVVGKMSGVIADADTIRQLGLAPLTPETPRAVLVERFHHILISRVTLEGFRRGIEVFVEKTTCCRSKRPSCTATMPSTR
jgi:hypothetical protein